jgi:excinuclease UvrABC nuclease subunit
MHLRFSTMFDRGAEPRVFFEAFSSGPAVFALFPAPRGGSVPIPYLGRTRNLRRRLARMLSPMRRSSRMLNLRELTARIEYEPVGSAFEALWRLYHLNKHYFPGQYRDRLRLRPPVLLKLNLRNRFPRCYLTRRLANDNSLYYGPFPAQLAAERFEAAFLDLFKIRRCAEDLDPDPSHPGCIYSQLHMCLAPCFGGCTDSAYQAEVQRVTEFLDTDGRSLLRFLESERAQASEFLEFEQAGKVHRRIEKVNELLRQRADLVRNLRALDAVIVLKGAEAKAVVFFRVIGGEIRGPAALSLDENVPTPTPLDRQLHDLLQSLAMAKEKADQQALPPWEHLSLLARWYYSSFREGELIMLSQSQAMPHTRLIRVCRKLLAVEAPSIQPAITPSTP